MPTTKAHSIVVVLGSGRSGTSLLMQALAGMGMRVSQEMVATRPDNPEGFFEDARIVRIQADLLRALGAWPYHPLPADWLERPETAAAGDALRCVLEERLAGGEGVWGFKDPRTASFLPLWQRLFVELDIAPRYILALREPGSILRSFMAAYETPAETAEQVWLQRICDALRHTRADCHIVQYEDWFSRASEVAGALARFTGLDVAASPEPLIRPDLNRSCGPEYAFCNPHARALHAALKNCRGDAFEREALLRIVAEAQTPHANGASPGLMRVKAGP
ncbi:MAG: sulfotransferase [Betaproteobacteria bacterium]|nr:sulfotransferase [Betaproteobacteria bacterium]